MVFILIYWLFVMVLLLVSALAPWLSIGYIQVSRMDLQMHDLMRYMHEILTRKAFGQGHRSKSPAFPGDLEAKADRKAANRQGGGVSWLGNLGVGQVDNLETPQNNEGPSKFCM